jgi:dynein heavy chain
LKCNELETDIPDNYVEEVYEDLIVGMGGFSVPLNIFLFQEVQRLQLAIDKVRQLLKIVLQAIRGEVVVTAEIMDAISSIFDARVPKSWLFSPAGDELSWLSPGLGSWFAGLMQRDTQYKTWLRNGRPSSYWMTGFFNPQGFITAIQQEITRAHKNDNWALDEVVVHAEVSDYRTVDDVKAAPKEGAYVHGLFLDGAAWDNKESTLTESSPKKLFASLPVLLITAVQKSTRKSIETGTSYGPYGAYECPVYKYPSRTDRYLIFQVLLTTQQKKPLHWILRGVALLCSTS